MEIKINLRKQFFSEKEHYIIQSDELSAATFLYSTGVCGLKIKNRHGYVVLLPFQGQQIWRINFLDHDLVMRTVFDEPRPTTDFLSTYGAFLVHCGLTAIGNPSPQDTHPLHGELPNAAYNEAWLRYGQDEGGKYLSLCGAYRYTVGFESDYMFLPECRLYEDATTVKIYSTIQNLRSDPLEYFYLCHINFRPIDGSRLLATTVFDKEHVKMHRFIPDNLNETKKKKLTDYLDVLEKDLSVQNNVDSASQAYDPEIVFRLKYIADKYGYAHSMQLMPDKYACYVRHNPEELPNALRWIARNNDDDALGLVLPSTAEHLGRIDCRANGYDRYIPPKGKCTFSMEAGLLDPERAAEMASNIELIVSNGR